MFVGLVIAFVWVLICCVVVLVCVGDFVVALVFVFVFDVYMFRLNFGACGLDLLKLLRWLFVLVWCGPMWFSWLPFVFLYNLMWLLLACLIMLCFSY